MTPASLSFELKLREARSSCRKLALPSGWLLGPLFYTEPNPGPVPRLGASLGPQKEF